MQRRWFVGLTVASLLLTAGAVLPASGSSDTQAGETSVSDTLGSDVAHPAQEEQTDPPQIRTPEGFNSTVFEIRLYENSSARWTIQHRRPLGNDNESIENFEAFAAEFNSTETQTYRDFKSRTQALTDFASDATDRRMNATDYSKNAEVRQEFRRLGVMEMSFTWTNFARSTDRGIVVDDVFEGGMYLGPGQRLVVIRPETLVYETVEPGPDDSAEENLTESESVEWFGEEDFADERPKLVVVQPSTLGETPPTNASDDVVSGALGPMTIAVAVVLLLVLGGVIAWYSGGLEGLLRGGDDSSGAVAESADADVGEPAPEESAVPEEELLSDEDRVLKLLDENGGRMKQVNIVEETEWSKSKVSMLLSDMEEEGLISKLRVGRENIISKAGEEPDAVGSPFDDE